MDTAQLVFADYAVIAGFFAVMLAIGWYYSGKMRTLQDYFSGSQKIPWWLSSISFYMSSFSAFTFVSYSALAYQYGWVAVTMYWVTVPASLLSAYFFASRWRRAANTSPLEYIEERFGPALRQWLAWLGIPVKVIDDGLKLFAIGTLVSAGLDFPLHWGILLSGGIMLTYTFLGGLWAVIITDFVQFVVMILVVAILVPLSFMKAGGVTGFLENIPSGFFALTTPKYNWIYLCSFFVIIALNYSTSWSLVQRYYSVRRDSEARKVGYLVAVLNVIGPPLFFFPAMAARVYLPDLANVNEVYSLLCRTLLPVGMTGMLIAAMFSATMSMISSDYNAVASVLTNDVYKRFAGAGQSDRSLVFAARLFTLLVGVVSLLTAWVVMNNPGQEDLFQLMVRLFSIFLPPVALPMLAGLITRRVSNAGGIAGLLLGMTTGLAVYVLGGDESYASLRQEPVITACTLVSTAFGLLAGTLARRRTPRQAAAIQNFFNRIESPEGPLPADTSPAQSASPLPVIGISIGSLGLLMIGVMLLTSVQEGFASLLVGFIMLGLGLLFCGAGRASHEGQKP